MNKNQKVIYEYNEAEGCFHENVGDYMEGTNGYQTVCRTTYGELDKFKIVMNAAVKIASPDGSWEWRHGKPTLKDLTDLWDAFTKATREH